MPRKIIRTMATAFTDCSTTRSRAAIFAHAKRTFIGSPKSALTLSTNASRKVFRSRASTAVISQTVPSAARKSHERFTRAAKPARHLSRLQKRCALRQSLFHSNPSHLHPAFWRLSIKADTHVRIAAQRRTRLGPETEGGHQQIAERNFGK